MFRVTKVQFFLPGYEVTDSGDDHPPVAVSHSEATVSQDHADYGDQEQEVTKLMEALTSLPPQQSKIIQILVEDCKEGRSKLEFNERTGKVIIKEINASRLARIPEHTFKMVSMGAKSREEKSLEIEEICSMIDQIKYKRSSSGAALTDKIGLSSTKCYKEDEHYKVQDILGEGLNATVTVVKDMKTNEHLAKKKVMIHNFNTNEIRAMYDLKDTGIVPELDGLQMDNYMIIVFMEIVENGITVKKLAEQLACSKVESFQVALFILIELVEVLDTMHNTYQWYHLDLHSENVIIENIKSGEKPWRIRIIDFGNAKSLSELKDCRREDLHLDLRDVLRQFCAIALNGDRFNGRYEFFDKYEAKLDECTETDIPKDLIKEIIKEGFAVQFQGEGGFVKFLESKLDTPDVSSEKIAMLLGSSLESETLACFDDVHGVTSGI